MIAGKNKTQAEEQWHHDVADICGCICCLLDGRPRDYTLPAHVSIHHCDGRTKAHAHYYVLPLCAGHHQQGHGPVPDMLAVHGVKARFIAEYGREIELVVWCPVAWKHCFPSGMPANSTRRRKPVDEGDSRAFQALKT
mgnify:CR=1 FL=1